MAGPSDPVRLAVLEAVAEALRGMDDPAVYHFPVKGDASVTLDATVNPLTANNFDLPLYVVEPTQDGNRDYFPAMDMLEGFGMSVTARMDVDASDPAARAGAWEKLAADVEVAVTNDVTLGGLVGDVRLGTPRPFVGVGSPIVLCVIPLLARIRREYGRP